MAKNKPNASLISFRAERTGNALPFFATLGLRASYGLNPFDGYRLRLVISIQQSSRILT